MNLTTFFKLTFIILFLNFYNSTAQWKTDEAKNIKNDIIITYSVTYDNELTEKQKKSSSYIKEIVVAFNKNTLKENRLGYSLKEQRFGIVSYNDETYYTCKSSSKSKYAIHNTFKLPKTEAVEQKGKTKKILGFNCEEYITIVKGMPTKIYSTKKIGLRYVKNFDIPGFLLEYTRYDKYLGAYKVVAEKITYAKLPISYYSLNDYTVISQEEYAEYKKKSSEKYKLATNKMLAKKTPKYRFKTLAGNKYTYKTSQDKIVVLNFWFTTCPPCKSEIPHLNELKEEFEENPNVIFIGIALDDKTKLNKFLKKYPFHYEIISDGRYEAEMFNVAAYPTNIIIDKKGIIQYYHVGGLSKKSTKALSYQIHDLLEIE